MNRFKRKLALYRMRHLGQRNRLLAFLLLAVIFLFLVKSLAAYGERQQESEAAARKIVAGALAAMGGPAALGDIRSLSMLGMTRVWVGAQEMKGSAKYTFARPDKYRVDVDLPSVKIIQAFNGKVGWGMENLKSYPPEIDKRIAVSMQVALTRGLLALLNTESPKAKLKVVAREELNGAKAEVVDFDDGAGNVTRFYFDLNTHLPSRAVYSDIDAEGHPVVSTDDFTNFRRVGAIRWPHHVVEYQAGERKREDVFTEVRINEKMPASFFNPVAP